MQIFRENIFFFVKEFFLVNIKCFLRNITTGFTTQNTNQNTPIIFSILSILLSICCCRLVVYYLTKPLLNLVSASQRTSTWRFYNTKFVVAVWKFCLVFLKLYFRSSPCNFPFVSLISSKPKQIRIKKVVNKRRKKN